MDGTDSSSVCSDDFMSFGFSATNAFSSDVVEIEVKTWKFECSVSMENRSYLLDLSLC